MSATTFGANRQNSAGQTAIRHASSVPAPSGPEIATDDDPQKPIPESGMAKLPNKPNSAPGSLSRQAPLSSRARVSRGIRC